MAARVGLVTGRKFAIDAPFSEVVRAVEEKGERGLAVVNTPDGAVSLSVATVAYVEERGRRWERASSR
jgi:hypothetical protein